MALIAHWWRTGPDDPLLLRIAAAGDAHRLSRALRRGHEPNTHAAGRSALTLAAHFAHDEVVVLLLRAGCAAHPNKKRAHLDGFADLIDFCAAATTKTNSADANDRVRHGPSALAAALTSNALECAALLLAAGALVDRSAVAAAHSPRAVRLLHCAAGAPLAALPGVARAPLLADAVRRGDLRLTRALLRAGAPPGERVRGTTPIALAVIGGAPRALVRRLLEAGADPNVGFCCGYSPLKYAARSGDCELVIALLAAGAHPDPLELSPFALLESQSQLELKESKSSTCRANPVQWDVWTSSENSIPNSNLDCLESETDPDPDQQRHRHRLQCHENANGNLEHNANSNQVDFAVGPLLAAALNSKTKVIPLLCGAGASPLRALLDHRIPSESRLSLTMAWCLNVALVLLCRTTPFTLATIVSLIATNDRRFAFQLPSSDQVARYCIRVHQSILKLSKRQ